MRFAYTLFLCSALCATSTSAKFSPDISSALHGLAESLTGVFKPQKQLENFWDEAQKFGQRASQLVLDEVTKKYPETAHVVEEFKDAMAQVVTQAQKIQTVIQNVGEKDTTIGHVANLLSQEIAQVYQGFEKEMNDPLPRDLGERAKARARLIARVMAGVKVVYIRVFTQVGVPHGEAESQFDEFSQGVTRVLLIAGNLIDEHPVLLEAVIFAASMFLLPEIPLLRPILTLFGFGPLGPIKGSTAAWAQSRFWGGAIARGSWFAILQRLGMTLTKSGLEKLVASAGLAATFGLAT